MTTLKMQTYTMPAADLGIENPNPDFNNVEYIHASHRCTDAVNETERKYIGKGMINTILPYTIQDNYNRDRKMTDFPAVVMENDYLKAVFLPTLGGRLWSLFDKRLNKELLYVNSAFQPANLAIRNAWFSGGVEWNFCIKGHNPLTCDPLFVEFAETEKGEPVLRMYEYERIRNVVISIEAYLPDDEAVLYFRNGIENTSKDEKYGYWWSNIAVPETEKTRVIAPTDEAFICFYNEGSYVLDKTDVPMRDGKDLSYPVNSSRSQDFFYKIPDNRVRWVAAVEEDGKGLLQFSQSILKGRKTFLWGQGAGGKHWSEFLSNPGEAYIEIQAGLAHTQLEHIPMHGGEKWSWIEAYCAADCCPSRINSRWTEAQDEVENCLAKTINVNKAEFINMDSVLEDKFPKTLINRKIMQNGSGWGYIENKVRDSKGKMLLTESFDFPENSVSEKESQWLKLFNDGEFITQDEMIPPKSYMVSPDWVEIAKDAVKNSDNWYAWLQYGVICYANDMLSESENALKKSLECKENPWAYRNLAMLAKIYKDMDFAVELMKKAIGMGCFERGLVINTAQIMTSAKKYADWLEVCKTLPESLQNDGRVLYYKALALVRSGDAKTASEIITPDFVMCDIKEGEASISHLWFEIYEALTGEKEYPLPYDLDFRMH